MSRCLANSKRKYLEGHIPKKFAEKHPNWKGGRVKDSRGYIKIYSPDHPNKSQGGYVFEHRLVMEEHLGRLLTKDEVVHHINEIKDDNRLENLELTDNTSHSIYHFLKFAVNHLKNQKVVS